MVQNGKFSAGIDYFDNMLNVDDFPMLAIPTIPIFKELIEGRPKSARTSDIFNPDFDENLKKICIK